MIKQDSESTRLRICRHFYSKPLILEATDKFQSVIIKHWGLTPSPKQHTKLIKRKSHSSPSAPFCKRFTRWAWDLLSSDLYKNNCNKSRTVWVFFPQLIIGLGSVLNINNVSVDSSIKILAFEKVEMWNVWHVFFSYLQWFEWFS